VPAPGAARRRIKRGGPPPQARAAPRVATGGGLGPGQAFPWAGQNNVPATPPARPRPQRAPPGCFRGRPIIHSRRRAAVFGFYRRGRSSSLRCWSRLDWRGFGRSVTKVEDVAFSLLIVHTPFQRLPLQQQPARIPRSYNMDQGPRAGIGSKKSTRTREKRPCF